VLEFASPSCRHLRGSQQQRYAVRSILCHPAEKEMPSYSRSRGVSMVQVTLRGRRCSLRSASIIYARAYSSLYMHPSSSVPLQYPCDSTRNPISFNLSNISAPVVWNGIIERVHAISYDSVAIVGTNSIISQLSFWRILFRQYFNKINMAQFGAFVFFDEY